MILFLVALAVGIVVLVKAADVFVTGAASTAARLGMSPMLIGMLIVGFGTSAPELVVSVISAVDGASGIALGNAWGSNIANIALILGAAALVRPIAVRSGVLRKELPVLVGVTVLAGVLVLDLRVSRIDAAVLCAAFLVFLAWSFMTQGGNTADPLATETAGLTEVKEASPVARSILSLTLGLLFLVASSRAIVWGAVGLAQAAGVTDLVIG
ncbi:MAG: calcium/sodium antiporter, partial [Spirochaetes bacterium]|nr:calcium/sodium antiporter [Spirochaetota bacterium]